MSWQVGKVKITKITEIAMEGGTRFILPQATYNEIQQLPWLIPDFATEGGKLKITTGTRFLDDDRDLPAGDYVLLSVSDTGSGIAPNVLPKVFDPFFTTKPVGRGTGLGLSQVYGFARQSRGLVQIDSTPGQGTTVTLCLPHAPQAAAPAAAREVAALPQGDGGLSNPTAIPPHFPVNRGGRFSTKLATPSLKSLPFSAICISRLASMVASASVWNGTS